MNWSHFASGFAVAFLLSGLVEYAVHRLLHVNVIRRVPVLSRLWKIHAAHHQTKRAQPWWHEGLDYCLVAFCTWTLAWPPLWLGMSFGAAAGWAVETVLWAFWAGWCHARSHGRKNDPHWLHHMKATVNLGIGTTVWDRVFGTYRDPNARVLRMTSEEFRRIIGE